MIKNLPKKKNLGQRTMNRKKKKVMKVIGENSESSESSDELPFVAVSKTPPAPPPKKESALEKPNKAAILRRESNDSDESSEMVENHVKILQTLDDSEETSEDDSAVLRSKNKDEKKKAPVPPPRKYDTQQHGKAGNSKNVPFPTTPDLEVTEEEEDFDVERLLPKLKVAPRAPSSKPVLGKTMSPPPASGIEDLNTVSLRNFEINKKPERMIPSPFPNVSSSATIDEVPSVLMSKATTMKRKNSKQEINQMYTTIERKISTEKISVVDTKLSPGNLNNSNTEKKITLKAFELPPKKYSEESMSV